MSPHDPRAPMDLHLKTKTYAPCDWCARPAAYLIDTVASPEYASLNMMCRTHARAVIAARALRATKDGPS